MNIVSIFRKIVNIVFCHVVKTDPVDILLMNLHNLNMYSGLCCNCVGRGESPDGPEHPVAIVKIV